MLDFSTLYQTGLDQFFVAWLWSRAQFPTHGVPLNAWQVRCVDMECRDDSTDRRHCLHSQALDIGNLMTYDFIAVKCLLSKNRVFHKQVLRH